MENRAMNRRRTPFFELHKESSAQFTEFAGWELPLHFGSAINEALSVRQDIGFFDISHMGRLKIVGSDVLKLFRKVFTRTLKEDSRGYYGFLVTQDGRIIDDTVVFRKSETEVLAVTNASRKEKYIELLRRDAGEYNLEVEIKDISSGTLFIAIQGPNARERTLKFISELSERAPVPKILDKVSSLRRFSFVEQDDLFISRSGYTGEDGFEIFAPSHLAATFWEILRELNIPPCGLAARDILRLEAGLILYGLDLTEDDTVFFSHLERFVERDFERYDNMRSLAEKNLTYLRGVVWDSFPIPKPREEVKPSGYVTSSVFSPILKKPISFVRFRVQVNEGDKVKAAVKGKTNLGSVTGLPFVKK